MGVQQNTWQLAFIVGTYPLLTTTFIDREIEALGRLGVVRRVVSIRRPSGHLSDDQRVAAAGVSYVLPARPLAAVSAHLRAFGRDPTVYTKTLAYFVSRPHPRWKDRLKTIAHFGVGVLVADNLRSARPDHLHAHFVDRATTVALVASRLLDIRYSATAHANDIYVHPVMLPEKVQEATFVATCTGYNAKHLESTVGHIGRIRRLYHGLDTAVLSSGASAPDFERRRETVLAVGQLKEKMGLVHLIRSIGLLRDRSIDVSCRILGEGPLRERLKAEAALLNLGDRIQFLGSASHSAVIAEMQAAAIFALPCVIAEDGDRDGIPNVILEAMALGLPVVSTSVSGIPEVVEDGKTGRLVSPGDEMALADALEELLKDANLRSKLGQSGRQVVEDEFDPTVNAARLLAEMKQEVSAS